MEKIEQIDIEGKKVIDFDDKLDKIEDYITIFESLEFDEISIKKFSSRKPMIIAKTGDKEYIFLIANITYLGNPHPVFKKRVQLKSWWKEVYEQYNEDYEILFLGLYKYKDNIVFVDFNIEDYVTKKMNNSSAHVYINDIYQAMNKKYYFKRDKKNNTINVIRKVYFKEYLNNRKDKFIKSSDEIINVLETINLKIPFNKDLYGDSCYEEMIQNDYSKKFQGEWPGFYIEYLYENILDADVPFEILAVNRTSKQKGELDFDLYSPKYDFYSDLKASDKSKRETPLNDKINIINALESKGKIWYIIYEHTTVKDKELDFRVCKYWNSKINKMMNKKKDLMSYSNRMKGIVNFKNMLVLEINKVNASEILKDFNQGKNSNGRDRRGKFKIKKSDIENYVIYRYGEINE